MKWILALALALLPQVAYAQLTAPTLIMDFVDAVDRTSYSTTNISPAVDSLVIITVVSRLLSSANTPTLTGCSMTWTQVQTGETSPGAARITIFRSTSVSPGSNCSLTADFGGQTQLDAWFIGYEFPNADVTGTNGSNGIVQAPAADNEGGASVTTASITLAAFGDAVNNGAIGCWYHGSGGAATAGGGFTLSGDQVSGSRRASCEYIIGEDTTVDMSWASTGLTVGIAAEIKMEDTAGGQAPRSMHQFRLRRM